MGTWDALVRMQADTVRLSEVSQETVIEWHGNMTLDLSRNQSVSSPMALDTISQWPEGKPAYTKTAPATVTTSEPPASTTSESVNNAQQTQAIMNVSATSAGLTQSSIQKAPVGTNLTSPSVQAPAVSSEVDNSEKLIDKTVDMMLEAQAGPASPSDLYTANVGPGSPSNQAKISLQLTDSELPDDRTLSKIAQSDIVSDSSEPKSVNQAKKSSQEVHLQDRSH